MPSHIYIRTGFYNTGIEVNAKANEGYQKYLTAFAPSQEGMALYLLHNLHMKMACAQMAGNYKEALAASQDLQNQIPDAYLVIGGALGNYVQYLHQSPLFTYIRFGKWDEILKEKVTDTVAYSAVLQHFGRGLAFARKGQLENANEQLARMNTAMQTASLKEPFTPFNSAYDAAVVAQEILKGVIAAEQNNYSLAILHLQSAVKAEDALIYNEPRDWVLPARQYLGDALLRSGRMEEAIAVFQKDLTINPSNGWDLIGLQMAYEKLKKTTEVITAKQRLKNAWLIKDTDIKRPVF